MVVIWVAPETEIVLLVLMKYRVTPVPDESCGKSVPVILIPAVLPAPGPELADSEIAGVAA